MAARSAQTSARVHTGGIRCHLPANDCCRHQIRVASGQGFSRTLTPHHGADSPRWIAPSYHDRNTNFLTQKTDFYRQCKDETLLTEINSGA